MFDLKNTFKMEAQTEIFNKLDGWVRIFRFPNDYGVSIARHKYSYGSEEGLVEVGVIKYHDVGIFDYELVYDTPITDDVIGRCDEQKVIDIMTRVYRL